MEFLARSYPHFAPLFPKPDTIYTGLANFNGALILFPYPPLEGVFPVKVISSG